MNLEDLKNTISNITVHLLPRFPDNLALRRQIRRPESSEWFVPVISKILLTIVVLNYSEMEAKVLRVVSLTDRA